MAISYTSVEYIHKFNSYIYGFIFKVSICDVNSSSGDTLAQELGQKFNKSVIFCPCDVTDYPQSEGSTFMFLLLIHAEHLNFSKRDWRPRSKLVLVPNALLFLYAVRYIVRLNYLVNMQLAIIKNFAEHVFFQRRSKKPLLPSDLLILWSIMLESWTTAFGS